MKVDKLTIAQFSDLHRSKDNPISNMALLDSLMLDVDTYTSQDLVSTPDILIISGDIVQGSTNSENAATLIKEQYDEALNFLNDLADKFFNGDKSRIILIPGNHDISWTESISSMVKIEEKEITDNDGALIKSIFKQAIKIDSNVKWSWSDRSFYRINDKETYHNRLSCFRDFYQKFYNGERSYSIEPDKQFDLFDFQELGITIVGFNSCFHNDHLNRAGSINPVCIGQVGLKLRDLRKQGRLILATWHHNTKGGPYDQNYMDDTFIKNLIAHDVKISFHGHQHRQEILRKENNIIDSKMMLVLSAGSLCAGPTELPAGYNRQYNLLELQRIDDEEIQLKLLSRIKTLESSFDNPIWDKGTFNSSTATEFTIKITHAKPPVPNLGKAERLIGSKNYPAALAILKLHDLQDSLVRKLLLECYDKLEDYKAIIEDFSEPQSNDESISLMNAIIEIADKKDIKMVLDAEIIGNSTDASVIHLREQLKGKLK